MHSHCKKTNRHRIPGECRILIFLFLFILWFSGCKQANQNAPGPAQKLNASLPPSTNEFFQEIQKESGLNFKHSIGDDDLNNIIESVGGGAAFLDYDQDGYVDLYVCSGTWLKGFSKTEKPEEETTNHLYRNQGDGTFKDVTKKAGAGGPWYSMGVSAGDFNNDGFPDLFLSNYGGNVFAEK